jgi:hypothetical protein
MSGSEGDLAVTDIWLAGAAGHVRSVDSIIMLLPCVSSRSICNTSASLLDIGAARPDLPVTPQALASYETTYPVILQMKPERRGI